MKTKEKEKEKEKEEEASPPAEKVLYDNRIKRKNVLALNEKVAAIREYEKMPVYKRIGRMFHCSPDQIKRIVQQKDGILKAWEQRTRRCQDAKTLEMKVVRVSMLGKAVYDWIRRMMYYKDLMITDGLIQKMALQFKSAMGLQNFFPHQDWCDKFRQTYNIIEHDSKKLKIGYTQGHSVQIKDVMKDVLSECTPDVVGESPDDDQEDKSEDERDNERIQQEQLSTPKPTTSTTNQPGMIAMRSLPGAFRQLVALPYPANRGMPQKVLVATPIRPVGQMSAGAPPMTMTIIPLTTIAQSQNTQAQATIEKQSVPPPLPEIKQEIKEEPPEFQIKQEYISDDEEVLETAIEPEGSINKDDAVATVVSTPSAIEKIVKESTKEADTMDYDNLALSSLRKIIQNKNSTSAATPNATKNMPTLTEAATTSTEQVAAPGSTMPPLPPLIKAPVTLINRTANKRKHNSDSSPPLPAIKTCGEARKYLKLLEDFALVRENFRLIGLVTRADEVLRELDGDDDVDID